MSERVDLSCMVKCVDLSLLPAVDSRPLYVAGSRNKAEFVELSDVGSAIVVHCRCRRAVVWRVGCRARVGCSRVMPVPIRVFQNIPTSIY